MKARISLGLALVVAPLFLVALFLVAPALAAEDTVTVTGNRMCAKCSLKAPGVTECQEVLVVGEGDAKTVYYLTANEVSKAAGHTCKGEKAATVTGTVSEADGKTWLAATSITPAG